MANKIYPLSHENILDHNFMESFIYPNKELHYYFSESFDEKFYIDLALKGFISIWYQEGEKEYLLPEIQFEYAILDFENLHISKKVKKLLKQTDYQVFVDTNFDEVIEFLKIYHDSSWIQGEYIELLKRLQSTHYKKELFSLKVFGIKDMSSNKIIAAELGYSTYGDKIYTSLSGFSLKEKQYNNYGTLQMVLLAQYLEQNKYQFWNLGHPYMEYKIGLGAVVVSREEFLQRLKTTYKI